MTNQRYGPGPYPGDPGFEGLKKRVKKAEEVAAELPSDFKALVRRQRDQITLYRRTLSKYLRLVAMEEGTDFLKNDSEEPGIYPDDNGVFQHFTDEEWKILTSISRELFGPDSDKPPRVR